MNSNLPPFLTPYEFIRAFTNAFNLTKQSKFLDDRAHNLTADYRDMTQALQEFVQDPLEQYLSADHAALLGGVFNIVFMEYLQLIPNVNLDGISRLENEQLLAKHFLPHQVVQCFEVLKEAVIPSPDFIVLLGSGTSAVSTVLTWAESNCQGWLQFMDSLSGDDKATYRNRIGAWKRGEDIPSLMSLKLIPQWSETSIKGWDSLQLWLLIARAIDWSKKTGAGITIINEVRALLWGATPDEPYPTAAKNVQSAKRHERKRVHPLVTKLKNQLKPTQKTDFLDPQVLKKELDDLRNELLTLNEQSTTVHRIDWLTARWYVFMGDLKSANKAYKNAFEGSLYRSGHEQKEIMLEARAVAASQKNPDKNFLKKIRNIFILFGLETPNSQHEVSKKNIASEFIEDWEINLWKADFCELFPYEGLFVKKENNPPPDRIGPLTYTDVQQVKPDLQNPNRHIKIGEAWKKKFPQLVWFCKIENIEIVKKLLDKGASLDCESDAGDTPILMALECMDGFDIPPKSLNRTLWDLISQHPQASAKINTRTHKRRLLPIIQAVKSGKPDVVRKVLELGADVDKRGETDEQTALNVCVKLIDAVKSPDVFLQKQFELGLTPAVLESIRRHTNGMVRDHNAQQHYAEAENCSEFKNFKEAMYLNLKEGLQKNYCLSDLYEIANILLEAGADPNAEHTSPIEGYTPLMLAAELNERALFERMLIKGGKPDKTYYATHINHLVDCWHIACSFESLDVLNQLNDIRQHFDKPEIR